MRGGVRLDVYSGSAELTSDIVEMTRIYSLNRAEVVAVYMLDLDVRQTVLDLRRLSLRKIA